MNLKRLLRESFSRSTPAKVAAHMFKALVECDDATLISLLLEDEASDEKEKYKKALTAELVSKHNPFVVKVYEIFKKILGTDDLNGTLELMRKRPAVAQAANYVIKLYEEYSTSPDLSEKMAMAKGDINAVREVMPKPKGNKPKNLPPKFLDMLAQSAKRDIEAHTIDFMQSQEAKDLSQQMYKWTDVDSGDVTSDDVANATGEPQTVQATEENFLSVYKGFLVALDKGAMKLGEVYAHAKWNKLLNQVAKHYKNNLEKMIRSVRSAGTKADNAKVIYQFVNGTAPKALNIVDFANSVAVVDDPRVQGPQGREFHNNVFIAVSDRGPFYELKYLFDKVSAGVSLESLKLVVGALQMLQYLINSDLSTVEGPGTMRI